MDAFQVLVSDILWREGYWVRSPVRVALTKAEKKKIGRPSSPRWEIDIVAYKARTNEVFAIECKSYLDSAGVSIGAFNGQSPSFAQKFKLFNEPTLRRTVLRQLGKQLIAEGLVRERPTVHLGLACGRIRNDAERAQLVAFFKKRRWVLWDEIWVRRHLEQLSHAHYENDTAMIVAKLLLRKRRTPE